MKRAHSATFCHFCRFTRRLLGTFVQNVTFILEYSGFSVKGNRPKVAILDVLDQPKNDPILSRLDTSESGPDQNRAQGGIQDHILDRNRSLTLCPERNNSGMTRFLTRFPTGIWQKQAREYSSTLGRVTLILLGTSPLPCQSTLLLPRDESTTLPREHLFPRDESTTLPEYSSSLEECR